MCTRYVVELYRGVTSSFFGIGILIGDEYAMRLNLYTSHFSDGVLFSSSAVYKKIGH